MKRPIWLEIAMKVGATLIGAVVKLFIIPSGQLEEICRDRALIAGKHCNNKKIQSKTGLPRQEKPLGKSCQSSDNFLLCFYVSCHGRWIREQIGGCCGRARVDIIGAVGLNGSLQDKELVNQLQKSSHCSPEWGGRMVGVGVGIVNVTNCCMEIALPSSSLLVPQLKL